MRRRLLLLLLGALAGAPLAAQQQGPSLGIELGYTRADFVHGTGVQSREGATAGAFFRVPLAGWVSLQPGLLIASKGGASATTIDSLPGTSRFDFDLVYLDLPLLLRLRLPAPGGTRLILSGGMAPGLRIGCNLELSNGGFVLARESCVQAGVTGLQDWDVAALGGAGLAIPIERSELALELRYSEGLRTLSDLSSIRNRSVTLLLSVPF